MLTTLIHTVHTRNGRDPGFKKMILNCNKPWISPSRSWQQHNTLSNLLFCSKYFCVSHLFHNSRWPLENNSGRKWSVTWSWQNPLLMAKWQIEFKIFLDFSLWIKHDHCGLKRILRMKVGISLKMCKTHAHLWFFLKWNRNVIPAD